MHRILVLALLTYLMVLPAQGRPKAQPLYGLALVVDPGHGGKDPGAHGAFKLFGRGPDVTVDEAPYVYDVSLRVAKLAKSLGAAVIMTRHDPDRPRPSDNAPSIALPFNGNHDVFTLGGKGVVARTTGMLPRMAAARLWQKRYGKNHHVAFVSIHFDIDPTGAIQGAHVIAPKSRTTLAPLIAAELINGHRARSERGHQLVPLAMSGDPAHGLRNLYVLRADKNAIPNRALVELGNFANTADVWRLRDPSVRQDFAAIIVRALVRFNR